MDFPEQSAWMRHRVSYGETDAMGVLYYAEYLHIFEGPAAPTAVPAAVPMMKSKRGGLSCLYARRSAVTVPRPIMMN